MLNTQSYFDIFRIFRSVLMTLLAMLTMAARRRDKACQEPPHIPTSVDLR